MAHRFDDGPGDDDKLAEELRASRLDADDPLYTDEAKDAWDQLGEAEKEYLRNVRPPHSDFEALAAAVQLSDAKQSTPLPETVARFIDPESLQYTAMQRASRGADRLGVPSGSERDQIMALLAATWIDGFIVAMHLIQVREIFERVTLTRAIERLRTNREGEDAG